MSGKEEDAESLETVFAPARGAGASTGEDLKDNGWTASKPKPVVVEGHGNGAGHAEDLVTTNGHHDEAIETQRLLFEWAFSLEQEREDEAELVSRYSQLGAGAGR